MWPQDSTELMGVSNTYIDAVCSLLSQVRRRCLEKDDE